MTYDCCEAGPRSTHPAGLPFCPFTPQYGAFRPKTFFNIMAKLMALLSTAMAIMGIVLVWILYPRPYDYSAVLGGAMQFFNTQRIGSLPASNSVPWLTSERTAAAARGYGGRLARGVQQQFGA